MDKAGDVRCSERRHVVEIRLFQLASPAPSALQCHMQNLSLVRLFGRCPLLAFRAKHAPKYRWVHFRSLINAVKDF
jgi:hypothetical protein